MDLNRAADAVLEAVTGLWAGDRRVIIAMDGRCASGKTTLAGVLQERTGCAVFHMDDYFPQPFQRTPERLSTPGGNVDYERFSREILIPLRQGSDTLFPRALDCATLTLSDPVPVTAGRLVLCEGSYSCHPALWDFCDLHIFLTISPGEQLKRLEFRNPEKLEAFRSRWIPLEERYFEAYHVEERCELVLNCSGGPPYGTPPGASDMSESHPEGITGKETRPCGNL